MKVPAFPDQCLPMNSLCEQLMEPCKVRKPAIAQYATSPKDYSCYTELANLNRLVEALSSDPQPRQQASEEIHLHLLICEMLSRVLLRTDKESTSSGVWSINACELMEQ